MNLTRGRWLIFWLLTLVAAFEFVARGPARAFSASGRNFNDFLSPYVQTRAWFAGRDPYSSSVLAEMWPVSSRPNFLITESLDGALPAKRGLPSPYLPLAFPVLLPVALLPWRVAIVVWILITVAALFVAAWALIQLAGGARDKVLAWMILLAVLLFAPVHTAIAASNIVTVVFALSTVATLCLTQNRNTAAGILLAIAAALKATIALPFVIYAVASQGRKKVIIPAIVAGTLLAGATAIPHGGAGLWWRSFFANNRAMFAPGAIDDFSTANPLAFQLVNLQAGVFPLLGNRTYTEAVVLLLFAILLAVWFMAIRRDSQVGLLDLAILASTSLLFIYHRFTDAGLLLVAVAWALSQLRKNDKMLAIVCLILAAPFLIPGATMLHELSENYAILEELSRSRAWDSFVLQHEPWLILAICVILLAARSRAARRFTRASKRDFRAMEAEQT